jgi:hypothetical protein
MRCIQAVTNEGRAYTVESSEIRALTRATATVKASSDIRAVMTAAMESPSHICALKTNVTATTVLDESRASEASSCTNESTMDYILATATNSAETHQSTVTMNEIQLTINSAKLAHARRDLLCSKWLFNTASCPSSCIFAKTPCRARAVLGSC